MPPQSDEGTPEEEQFLRDIQAQFLAQEKLRTQALNDLLKDRKTYGDRVYRLIVLWLIGIGTCILAQAISVPGIKWFSFHLSDAVLIALIGATTATVVGLFLVVVRSIFDVSETGKQE